MEASEELIPAVSRDDTEWFNDMKSCTTDNARPLSQKAVRRCQFKVLSQNQGHEIEN